MGMHHSVVYWLLRAIPVPVLALALAAVHYVVSWVLFLAGFSLGLSDFDEGPTAWGIVGRLLFAASQILWWPVWQFMMADAREISPGQSHVLLACNSGVWGAVIAVSVRAYIRRRARRREAMPPPTSSSDP